MALSIVSALQCSYDCTYLEAAETPLNLLSSIYRDNHAKMRVLVGLTIICIIYCLTPMSRALECYACESQEGNREKCLNTIVMCEHGQDTCSTEMRWGTTPYWTAEAEKKLYVSKKCAVKSECEQAKHKNGMADCSHLKYQDWQCQDCCKGDRCNYYIISAANKLSSPLCILSFMFLPIFMTFVIQL